MAFRLMRSRRCAARRSTSTSAFKTKLHFTIRKPAGRPGSRFYQRSRIEISRRGANAVFRIRNNGAVLRWQAAPRTWASQQFEQDAQRLATFDSYSVPTPANGWQTQR